ncbi:hypothetical protein WN943_015343 [Citrus x changshan-huyou]
MDRCSEEVNQLVMPFNAHVKTMINNLNANLPGARFTFIDIARMFEDLLTNYRSYEAVNIMFGRKAFYGDQSVVYPMNIQQLASL